MGCEFEPDLTAALDGELAPPRAQAFEAHLGRCGPCSQSWALLRGAVAQLDRLPAPVASPRVRAAVLSRIAEPAAPSGWRRLLAARVWGPSLAAAALAVLLLWVWPSAAPETLWTPARMELAANLEVLEDLELMGIESEEDLELLAQLDTVEAMP